jgi:DNA polymerase III alpha subunit
LAIPICVYTDASLAHGNDLPSKMVSVAKDNGYNRVAIIDFNSMASVVAFAGATKSVDIAPIIGVSLSVYSEGRESLLWAHKNKGNLALLAGLFKSDGVIWDYDTSLAIFLTLSKMSSLLQGMTAQKVKNCVETIRTSGVISLDGFKFDNSEPLEMVNSLLFFVVNNKCGRWSLLKTSADLGRLSILMGSIDFARELGSLVFIAKTTDGYKELMALASVMAIRKSELIRGVSKKELALYDEDLNSVSKNIIIIDPLTSKSFLGGVLHSLDESDCIKGAVGVLESACIHCCINIGFNFMADERSVEFVGNVKAAKVIPFVSASFACSDDFEGYSVKYAVHNDLTVGDIDFVPPDRTHYIHCSADVEAYFGQIEGIDHLYWDKQVEDTAVVLGCVSLPNYDMPEKDVIEYALGRVSGANVVFDDAESANAAFNLFLEKEHQDASDMASYRQRRLNDFCMLKIAIEGLDARLTENYGEDAALHRAEYVERIEHEFFVIEDMGFSGYFLIEFECVSYARSVGIPVGPGRGSAAGSLIVYCMEITDVDPIIYGLQFERFLNPCRVSMPDIDVDFGDGGGGADRGLLLSYMRNKFQQKGSKFPSTSQVANIMRYQVKSAVASVRKAYGLSMECQRDLDKLILSAKTSLGKNKTESITWKELLSLDNVLKRVANEPMLSKIFSMARSITGKMANFGVHAGGVVISPTVVTDFSAISCDDHGNYFTQFDKDDIESAGLIKFDMLGSKTLSIAAECCHQIFANHGVKIDPRKINVYDPAVYELICQQTLADIFQLESSGMRDLVGNLRPQSIEELGVLSALFRPGALASGMVAEYTDVKQGVRAASYDHPSMKTVTEDTLGCIVYQEQVMSIVRELAGYTLGQADVLRRVMGKKKVEEMAKQRAIYTGRAMEHWRESGIEAGAVQGYAFKLDVNLADFSEHMALLNIGHCFADGYLVESVSFVEILGTLLSLNDADKDVLASRMLDYHYIPKFFAQHYRSSIEKAVFSKLGCCGDDIKLEVFYRLYYALSQYIRFNQVFNKVEKFAGYGFNKSHAIAYSVVTYNSAYLKCYYPAEFYSAVLCFKELDLLGKTVVEAVQKFGIKVVKPDINKSARLFHVETNVTIRYGLDKLKNMGSAGEYIIKARGDVPFVGVFDFLTRVRDVGFQVPSGAFFSLSMTGAFDDFIPKIIHSSKDINGRQYISWLRDLITGFKPFKNGGIPASEIHAHIDSMTDKEFVCYLLVFMSAAKRKNALFTPHAINAGLLVEKGFPLAGAIALGGGDAFCALFVKTCLMYGGDDELWERMASHMRSELGVAISATLELERDLAGFYITSTPIKVLKIAQRVDREPPGSMLDGCPVKVENIDIGYVQQSVTTYGTVRDVALKTVKNIDSSSYGQKMLFFCLEEDGVGLNCLIFGTKNVDYFSKIITEGAIALIAGEVRTGTFGLTLGVRAMKRYFPVEDQFLHATKM